MAYSSHSVAKLEAPFRAIDEGVFVIPKGGAMRLGKHHFKVLFILDGKVDHEIEGLAGRRALGPGDILIAPVVRRHEYINPDKSRAVPLQAIRMFLDADYLSKCARRRIKRPETDLGDFISRHFDRVVQLTGGIDNEITALIRQFREETEQQKAGFRHRVRSLCTDLIVCVARKIETGAASQGARMKSSPSQTVSAAKEYILKHLSRDLRLGEIAWHVGKGEEHLARTFRRETGQSVFGYVRESRVNLAKTLLLNPALSLTEIASRIGFNSLPYFSRSFRLQTGLAPSDYRKNTEIHTTPLAQLAAASS